MQGSLDWGGGGTGGVLSITPFTFTYDGNIYSGEKMTKEDPDFFLSFFFFNYASIYLLTRISFVVQLLSCVRLFATPMVRRFPFLHYLWEFIQTHVH